MCNFENGFILCSCLPEAKPIVHHKNSRKHKNSLQEKPKGYRWTLARFVGTYEALMEGIYELPAKDLGNGLEADWVLLNLNCTHCFDFDYTPQEGDNLLMRSDAPYTHLSFIFRQGNWVIDRYNGFSTILEKIHEGKIQTKE